MSKKREAKIIKHEDYLSHRSYLINEKHKILDSEIKFLLLLSTWVFSLFITYTQSSQWLNYVVYIILSQSLLLISLLSILSSMIFSKKSFDNSIINHDETYKLETGKRITEYNNANYSKLIVIIFLWTARFTFILWITIWFVIYSLNFYEMNSNSIKIWNDDNEKKYSEPSERPVPIEEDE